jgi:hypothetical protein
MNSYGIYEIDLWVKGKKFAHPVNVIHELNDTIFGIDLIYNHKLTCDMINRQVKFVRAPANTISAVKQIILLALTSRVINAKFKGKKSKMQPILQMSLHQEPQWFVECHQLLQLMVITKANWN